MKNINIKLFKVTLTLTIIFIISCSENSVKNNISLIGKDTVFQDIKWTDETFFFNSNELQDVVEFNNDNDFLRIKSTNQKAKSLKEGDIIVLAGKALKKVVSVEQDGDFIDIETEDALIVEAIKDGKIFWDFDVDFKKLKPLSVHFDGKEDRIQYIQGMILNLLMNGAIMNILLKCHSVFLMPT